MAKRQQNLWVVLCPFKKRLKTLLLLNSYPRKLRLVF